MNKVLHVLVYVFLALAAAALWFELKLNAQRSLLTDRNRQQEDYLVRIAKTIEKSSPDKSVVADPINMDVSPVEARIIDSPDQENVLEGYNAYLETSNLETFQWDNPNDRAQLRKVYLIDESTGKPVMDLGGPVRSGPGTAEDMLGKLFEFSKTQQSNLNTTRAELASLRRKFASVVEEVNRVKPEARQALVTVSEKEQKIVKLEGERADLENQVIKIKGQIDDLNTEIVSLRDAVDTARQAESDANDELEKARLRIKTLEGLLRESVQARGVTAAAATDSIVSLSAGDKGVIVEADNEDMFAIIKLSDEAMKELKGEALDRAMPTIELAVRRSGYKGDADEFVGRVRLRQEVKGKNYVICDILEAWEQAKLKTDDIIFAD